MLLQQEKIIQVLNKLLNQTPKIRKGTELLYVCPFCNKKNKRKLEISITGKYHCWTCQPVFAGQSFFSLFKKLNAPAECYSVLGDIKPIDISANLSDLFKEVPEVKQLYSLPNEFISLYEPTKEIGNSFTYNAALKYIKNRGITDLDLYRYNIGYCETGQFRNRIVIPSYDSTGCLNFYSCRDFFEISNLKYVNSQFSKDIIGFENLLNFNDEITLVEGTFDAIAVRKNCCPLFGKTLSDKLKYKLIEYKTPMVNVLLDNDAFDDALTICDYLIKHEINVKLIDLDEKDPSSIGFKKTWEYINSTNMLDFDTLFKLRLNL